MHRVNIRMIYFKRGYMMLELLSLVFFGMIVYTFLVIIPATVEMLATDEFKCAYFSHLASRSINSYGK